jgi:hypothetical protein
MLTARAVEISIATVTLARADEMIEYRAMSGVGTKRTSCDVRNLVAIRGKADMAVTSADFRF